jgi:hypothetical protein
MTSNKKDLYNLVDGWLELESDPGLFTLLLEDMGVVGVQVSSWTWNRTGSPGDLKPHHFGIAGAIYAIRLRLLS